MKKHEEQAVELLTKAAELLGWNISFEGTDEELTGLHMGTEEFLDHVVSVLDAWDKRV